MQDEWDITVLSTCAKDYLTWENYYPSGPSKCNGVKVHRFPVKKPRNFESFSKYSYATESKAYAISSETEAQYFEAQGPFSPELIDSIEASYDSYDFFIFFTYLYYPTVIGLPKVADKAYLLSTAHDEPPLYFLRTYAPLFHSLRGIIYLSEDERNLVNRVYEIPSHVKQYDGIFGLDIPEPFSQEEEAIYQEKFKEILEDPFYLYLGRASESKRCFDMIHAYVMSKRNIQHKTRLIFAGSIEINIDVGRDDIVYLGFLTEREKSFLLRSCIALINPSPLESLSLVLLEAWAHRTPVLVNGNCRTTKQLCDDSSGGLYYHSEAMFQGLLEWLYHNPSERQTLGKQGYDYVLDRYNWGKAKQEFLRSLR